MKGSFDLFFPLKGGRKTSAAAPGKEQEILSGQRLSPEFFVMLSRCDSHNTTSRREWK